MRLLQGLILLLGIFGISSSSWSNADVVRIAVSSTLEDPIVSICQKFNQKTNFRCKLTNAPAGHLYAHIMHGMAYDLFVSSDETYTLGLVNANLANPNSRFTIAKGRIVLWSPDPKATPKSLEHALTGESNQTIAIANPSISSYGAATKEALQNYHLWQRLQDRLVFGKNVKHTFELINDKNSIMGFVALSQLPVSARKQKKYWEPQTNSYKPILYEMITLKTLNNAKATSAFVDFLKIPESCQIMQEHGFSCG